MSYNIYDSVNKRLVNIAGSPSVFTGATASTPGTTGIVPAPAAGSQNKTLKADGTWGEGLAPTEINYEDWMELTPEERNAGQWLVTDFPQSMNASLIPYTGDVSAANVGDAIDTLNQNLTKTLIYNPQDDYFYLNGVKTMYRGYQNAIAVYVNGVFGIDVENGAYSYNGSDTVYVFENTNNELTGLINTSSNERTIVSKNIIDFTNYDYIKVTDASIGEVTLDVRNLNNTGYLWITFLQNYMGERSLRVGVSSTKQAFGTTVLTKDGTTFMTVMPTTNNYTHITSITVE